MLIYVLVGLIAAVIAMMIWVRVAPLDLEARHAEPPSAARAEAHEGSNRYIAIRDVDDAIDAVAAMDAIIMASPRTTRVAGAPGEQRITYVTRTRLMGYPDFTTVLADRADAGSSGQAARLAVYGRSRFGKSDLGVNKARIEGWLAQFDATAR